MYKNRSIFSKKESDIYPKKGQGLWYNKGKLFVNLAKFQPYNNKKAIKNQLFKFKKEYFNGSKLISSPD